MTLRGPSAGEEGVLEVLRILFHVLLESILGHHLGGLAMGSLGRTLENSLSHRLAKGNLCLALENSLFHQVMATCYTPCQLATESCILYHLRKEKQVDSPALLGEDPEERKSFCLGNRHYQKILNVRTDDY
jgi:hypothetical protein